MGDNDENAAVRAATASAQRSLELQCPADVCMENLIMKLHLLNYRPAFYDSKFGKHRSAIHSSYFANSAPGRNQAEQFFTFINLAAWLLTEFAGVQVKPLKEGDDATAALNQLLTTLKQLKFAVSPVFTPAKLQAGFGLEVCGILDSLADLALERSSFKFNAPTLVAEDEEGAMDTAPVDHTGEMQPGELETAALPADEYDIELLQLGRGEGKNKKEARADVDDDDRNVLQNTIDPASWELEVQQVAPKLLIRVAAEARDWRTHLEAASQDKEVLVKQWPGAQSSLMRLRQEVADHLEKVDTRENFLNGEFASWTDEYRNKKEVFALKQAEYEKNRAAHGEGLAELQKYVDQIEEMQGDLDARSSTRSDAGPTLKVRKAIEGLQAEIKQMDVQLGVMRQQLLLTRMKERVADAQDIGI